MKFIELTNANTGDPVLINAEEIRLVAPQFTGTRIVLGDGKNSLCDVSECYNDIINELRRINDLQFCFIESTNKNPNMYFGE